MLEAQKKALEMLHEGVVLSDVDEKLLKRLGINVSCEPRYETKKLYHK